MKDLDKRFVLASILSSHILDPPQAVELDREGMRRLTQDKIVEKPLLLDRIGLVPPLPGGEMAGAADPVMLTLNPA